MLKNKSGVSLVQVVVAIIIIIVITSFAIWYASNTSTEAKLTRIYAEISAVKEAYENTKVLDELHPGTNTLSDIQIDETALSSDEIGEISELIDDKSEVYLITPDNAKKIEAEKVTQKYVIDGTTGKVYLVGGFQRKEDDAMVFEYEDIVRVYKSTLK